MPNCRRGQGLGMPNCGDTKFEVCSASIAARANDLIGIYDSDNGWKEKQISIMHVERG